MEMEWMMSPQVQNFSFDTVIAKNPKTQHSPL